MLGMSSLAEHIIAVAKDNGRTITNLQVQKIMFFSLGMHIRQTGKIDDLVTSTYTIPFEKWKYGPVVESIYYQYNKFKDNDIDIDGKIHEEYKVLNELISSLLNINVFELVNLSHRLPSWKKYEDDIMNRNYVASYTLEEIAEDFLNG